MARGAAREKGGHGTDSLESGPLAEEGRLAGGGNEAKVTPR